MDETKFERDVNYILSMGGFVSAAAMRHEHMVCIGTTTAVRKGRTIVETFKCSICGCETETSKDAPRWYHKLLS